MNTDAAYVIVGSSLAGAKAAETLREDGFGGPVVLIGEGTERPYERPPLSKDYLLGKAGRETIYVHPQPWYAERDVDLRLGARVADIDPSAHEVRLADGSRVGYARLLLTTGSALRRAVPDRRARRGGGDRADPGDARYRDHIDPSTKVFAVCAGLSKAWDVLVEEALKTQLLCKPCHAAKGAEDRPDLKHGTYHVYWYWNCRCDPCKAANARKSAALRDVSAGGFGDPQPFRRAVRSAHARQVCRARLLLLRVPVSGARLRRSADRSRIHSRSQEQ